MNVDIRETSNQPKAIEVNGLTKRYGDHVAVQNATFEIPWGAVTGFVGANGSGKTTTMRMLVELALPSSGTSLVAGKRYSGHARPREVVGAALDRLGAHPGITGRQHLQTVAKGASISSSQIGSVLDTVGLADPADRRLGKYSTGMKQRLALATALLAEPQVLILDEPARGLDPSGIRWLRELLRAKADAGAAVFVSTHQLAELAVVVDYVVMIDRGVIVASEATGDLLARTGTSTLEEAVFRLSDSQPKQLENHQ